METDGRPRGYAICTEPRSGSSFLGRILASTGALGRPKEYFGRAGVRAEIFRDPEAGLRKLVERASTPNGIYGLKLFTYDADRMAGSRWVERLPGLHFIHLERKDLLGQAISFVRSAQTGRVQSWQTELRPARYDARAIARQLRRVAGDQARWRLYFARRGAAPLHLVYEQIAAEPQAAAAAVAALVGVDPPPRIDESAIDLAILRDDLSEEWRRRFLAERADPNLLSADGIAWPIRSWLRRMRRTLDVLAERRDPRGWP